MSDGIIEEISELRAKCASLNGEIKDLVLKHSKKQAKIQNLADSNNEIQQLIDEMKAEIDLFYEFDEMSAKDKILQLEKEIERTKKEKREFAIEAKRLQEVSDIKSQSISKQNIRMMSKQTVIGYDSVNKQYSSSLIILRHQLEEELNTLNASNAPAYQISRKKAQIIHLLELTNN